MKYVLELPKDVVGQIGQVGIPKRELADVVKDYVSQRALSAQGVIDLQLADGGRNRTQQDWISYFNKEGKVMISSSDVYRAGKAGSSELITSLRKDFDARWLMTSSRIIYDPNTLDAKIIDNFGSTIVQPAGRNVVAPVYQGTSLNEVLGTKEGRAYVSALFNTNDNYKRIIRSLTALSGKKAEEISVWTPNQKDRAEHPERVVDFLSDDGRFHVNGNYWIDDGNGLSRGVSVVSAKPTCKSRT